MRNVQLGSSLPPPLELWKAYRRDVIVLNISGKRMRCVDAETARAATAEGCSEGREVRWMYGP